MEACKTPCTIKACPKGGGIQVSSSSGASGFCVKCIISLTIRTYIPHQAGATKDTTFTPEVQGSFHKREQKDCEGQRIRHFAVRLNPLVMSEAIPMMFIKITAQT